MTGPALSRQPTGDPESPSVPYQHQLVYCSHRQHCLVVPIIPVITLHPICVLVGGERIKALLPMTQWRHDSDSGQREAFWLAFDPACKVRSDLNECDCVKWLHAFHWSEILCLPPFTGTTVAVGVVT